jgi:hypothetical protein
VQRDNLPITAAIVQLVARRSQLADSSRRMLQIVTVGHDMRILMVVAVALAAFVAATPFATAADSTPECTTGALDALKQIPAPAFQCDNSYQNCSSDKASSWEDQACRDVTKRYEKTLNGLLTRQWWSVDADALEACRIHGKVGALTKDEADSLNLQYGNMIQGTDRVRMLVVGDACGIAGMSNEFLVVRTANGLAVTPLYFDFNQGGQEGPFGLDVARNGPDTFALFTTLGHDMQSAYTTTMAYRIDPKTGYATWYPLFLTAAGPDAELDQSQPVISDVDVNYADTEMVKDGRLVKRFNAYSDNLCGQDHPKCQPVKVEAYSWNGAAFVVNDYSEKRAKYVRELTRQRECIKRKFDPKKGSVDCGLSLNCPSYNDLAWLSIKAGNMNDARNYSEEAVNNCRGNLKEFPAALYNYRKSHASR